MTNQFRTDRDFLHYGLCLAARHEGRTCPNPSVGCVIVNDGQVLATAVTAQGGRPHAETEALASIGELARAATVYRDSREAKDFESFVENEAL